MAVGIAEAEFFVHCLMEVVILKEAGKDMMELLLIGQLAAYGNLGLMQLCGCNHLHR